VPLPTRRARHLIDCCRCRNNSAPSMKSGVCGR
jgi:hypothetical protein